MKVLFFLILQDVQLQLWETAGQEGYDRIRKLNYDGTHCFVVCFSCVDLVTFDNVKNVWLKELRESVLDAKILLVGTKADLRGQDLGQDIAPADSDRNKEVTNNNGCIF